MSEAFYGPPEHPSETDVDTSHTKLLYYTCNELISQRVSNKLIRYRDDQLHMYADLADAEIEFFDDFFVELPHTAPTEKLEHTLIVEACTKGWFSRGRFGKCVLEHTPSGYPTISLTVERSRLLASPLGKQHGWFIMDSSISYECDGRGELLIRQEPEVIDQSLKSLTRGKDFARDNDSVLWEAISPYWSQAEFNIQAIRTGNYKDFRTTHFHEEDLSEYVGPASVEEFSVLMGIMSRIKTTD